MRTRGKLLAASAGLILTGLGLYLGVVKPRNDNIERYLNYQMRLLDEHKSAYGSDPKSWTHEGIEDSMRNEREIQCLDRYMAENQPFAQAVSTCKQEAAFP